MGFNYLIKKMNWIDVTREERLFCCHLYWAIKNDLADKDLKFIDLLNNISHKMRLAKTIEWEIGYEVCFFRDLLKTRNESVKIKRYSPKRTFDLCLFSNDTIVVIEAKAQQGFNMGQMIRLKKDEDEMHKVLGNQIRIVFLGLCAREYWDSCDKQKWLCTASNKRDAEHGTRGFDDIITWDELATIYSDPVIRRANGIYNK